MLSAWFCSQSKDMAVQYRSVQFFTLIMRRVAKNLEFYCDRNSLEPDGDVFYNLFVDHLKKVAFSVFISLNLLLLKLPWVYCFTFCSCNSCSTTSCRYCPAGCSWRKRGRNWRNRKTRMRQLPFSSLCRHKHQVNWFYCVMYGGISNKFCPLVVPV